MARRKVHATKFGPCAVSIYKDSYVGEYVVQASVGGKIQGDGYFTDDKKDARSTAAFMVRDLKKRPSCQRPKALNGARRRAPKKRRK